MLLGTMPRTEGSREKSPQLSMKYICQMHGIQTDGESLTLCCKHAALFKFLCLLIYLAAFLFMHLCAVMKSMLCANAVEELDE